MSFRPSGGSLGRREVSLRGFLPARRFLLIAEQYCRGCGLGFPALSELSHEDFAQDDIAGVLEDGGEDDSDPVSLGLNIHCLIVTIVDDSL